ncbi:ABC transporter ATP-binding protein [Neoroseomonas oryzicola]|uniref:ABC transporter ATP-binding protein n=1 Tax=Neoroseomonas oryzicola TaxID=535904 RepID=A0A9X9WFI5_9PROT|nr:ABC transporter ATP-binding protein [Neoroseomonas oryzicola]MBR0659095.1 ABC transporter ATP-binding protein [Neoroseomonas oryzicola]NKE17032.1 ABC transporter ATP-binding protein [Neoroseomonas oryzicola]
MTRKTGAEVRLEGIGKRYGQVQAVKPLDLVIEGGTLVTLLGPSGCGKTTLLRMIAGLEQATDGRLFIGGRDVTLLPAGERNVSMVFQSYALFPHMSVLDNVAYGLVSSGMRKRDAHAKAEAALETVGLKGFGTRLPSEMSGGQQQRVAVARALVLEPEVLLFDEPLSNLDARLRRSMREEIRALQQRLGLTVVYVTHDQSEALAVSDRIVVMRNAEIAQAGTPEELYTRPSSVFVATFMGEANRVPGTIESVTGGTAQVAIGGMRVGLPDRGLQPGPADVVIRPEAIRIMPADAPDTLPATVSRATYMGSHTEYLFATEVGELFAVGPQRLSRHREGEQVRLGLDLEGVVLVAP